MGEVYCAQDTELQRPVALKRIPRRLGNDPEARQRILREARRASGLNSEHIAGIHDVIEEQGELFLVMEYVEGDTLRRRLQQPILISQRMKEVVMDLLITVIGNAVMDPAFASKLLADPMKAMDDWHFRLTKYETGMLTQMCANLNAKQKQDLETKFESLHTTLYKNRDEATTMRGLDVDVLCPTRRCTVSVYPPEEEARAELRNTPREAKTQAA